jgi:hypothetical protein
VTHTKRDFKPGLATYLPQLAATVASKLTDLESLSSTPARFKTQLGYLHQSNLVISAALERLVGTVCKSHASVEGSTVSLAEGNMAGRRLFVVPTYPERSVELISSPTWQNIFAFAWLNLDVLVRQHCAVGSWLDRLRSAHVLDVVVCVLDRRTAIKFGWYFGQTSIYDLCLRREIVIRPLKGQGHDATFRRLNAGQNDCRRLHGLSELGTEGQ